MPSPKSNHSPYDLHTGDLRVYDRYWQIMNYLTLSSDRLFLPILLIYHPIFSGGLQCMGGTVGLRDHL